MKRKTRIISILLLLTLVFTFTPISASAYSGNGTKSDPIVVTSYDELRTAMNRSSTGTYYVKLGSNIYSYVDKDTYWLGGGSSTNKTKIVLDLNGHTVSRISATSDKQMISVGPNYTLEINDSVGGGGISANLFNEEPFNYLISVSNGGTLTVNAGTFEIKKADSYQPVSAYDAVCIYSNSGNVTINNGYFKGKTGALEQNSYGTQPETGNVIINNGTFEVTSTYAVGICFGNRDNVVINNCKIISPISNRNRSIRVYGGYPSDYVVPGAVITIDGDEYTGGDYESIYGRTVIITAPIKVTSIPITASWSSDFKTISSYSTTAPGCKITKVEMAKNGQLITQATPGDTINVAFTVVLSKGYEFDTNCHATWNGQQENAKISGSTSNTKRFAFTVKVPEPSTAITSAALTNIDEPVIGQHPDFTAASFTNTDDGIQYQLEWYGVDSKGNGKDMTASDVFEKGYRYICYITLYPMGVDYFPYNLEYDDYGDEVYNYAGKFTVNGMARDAYLNYIGHLNSTWWSKEAKPAGSSSNPFTDVKSSDYFYEPVLWAVANGITSGTSATTFSPNAICTRAQVVTFLWRAAGQPEPAKKTNPFTDVKSSEYYYKAVLWAVEKGITSGVSATEFAPNSPCTRGQVVTFQWRAAGQPAPTKMNNPFTDVKSSEYYYKPVLWAVEKGITSGMSSTTFEPNSTCRRGQIVTFLYRQYK